MYICIYIYIEHGGTLGTQTCLRRHFSAPLTLNPKPETLNPKHPTNPKCLRAPNVPAEADLALRP